jgi:tellurite resistance protein TehA-like permease
VSGFLLHIKIESLQSNRFTRQTHSQDTISAALLLPIVSTVVAASSGGVVAGAIAPFDPQLARSTVIVSYVVWGTGVPVALFFITMWIHRTIIGGVPSAAALPTLFLPLGPCGQGSYGIILLGHVTRNLAYTHNIGFTILPEGISSADAMLRIADAVYASCLVTGLILWGLALVWYTVAMTITIDHGLRNKVYFAPRNFSIGWTAYTFPIGVWATATNQLAIEFGSPAFKVIGTAVSVQVILQWAYVFAMCCIKAWQGTIFVAPEVSKWEGRPPLRFPSRKPDHLGKSEV